MSKSFEEIRKEWVEGKNLKIEISDFNEGNDICVLCGKESPYPIELEVDSRHCYIEGKGQLCLDCCKKFNDKRL